jgi:hypothetical protein
MSALSVRQQHEVEDCLMESRKDLLRAEYNLTKVRTNLARTRARTHAHARTRTRTHAHARTRTHTHAHAHAHAHAQETARRVAAEAEVAALRAQLGQRAAEAAECRGAFDEERRELRKVQECGKRVRECAKGMGRLTPTHTPAHTHRQALDKEIRRGLQIDEERRYCSC